MVGAIAQGKAAMTVEISIFAKLALENAGITVCKSPAQIGNTVADILKNA